MSTNSYEEHALVMLDHFKNDLKKIKREDFEAEKQFIMRCNNLLIYYRNEFNKICANEMFGEITIKQYIDHLKIYSIAQRFLEEYIEES